MNCTANIYYSVAYYTPVDATEQPRFLFASIHFCRFLHAVINML